MPRGHKTSLAETNRVKNCWGLITDEKSFVSQDGGLFLAGEDWTLQKHRVWKRDNGRCQLCKKIVLEHEIADPDHIVKRSDGGDDSLVNLRTAHRTCHEKRHPEKALRFGEIKKGE